MDESSRSEKLGRSEGGHHDDEKHPEDEMVRMRASNYLLGFTWNTVAKGRREGPIDSRRNLPEQSDTGGHG
jgi:hypothetical protein